MARRRRELPLRLISSQFFRFISNPPKKVLRLGSRTQSDISWVALFTHQKSSPSSESSPAGFSILSLLGLTKHISLFFGTGTRVPLPKHLLCIFHLSSQLICKIPLRLSAHKPWPRPKDLLPSICLAASCLLKQLISKNEICSAQSLVTKHASH